MPLYAKSTVTLRPDCAESVAAKVATPPASAMLALSTPSVTLGASSSSVIVVVRCWVPCSVPLVTLSISTTTVSLSSSRVSSPAVTITVPVVSPAAMTICVPERV